MKPLKAIKWLKVSVVTFEEFHSDTGEIEQVYIQMNMFKGFDTLKDLLIGRQQKLDTFNVLFNVFRG